MKHLFTTYKLQKPEILTNTQRQKTPYKAIILIKNKEEYLKQSKMCV